MSSGIYKLVFKGTNKVYIGRSTDLDAREKQHIQKLHLGSHPSKILQQAFYEFGEPKLIVVEYLSSDLANLLNKESYYIKKYDSYYNGFNGTKGEAKEDPRNSYEDNMARTAFLRLVLKDNEQDICMDTGFTPKMLKQLKECRTHQWLQAEFPNDWRRFQQLAPPRQYSDVKTSQWNYNEETKWLTKKEIKKKLSW